MEFPLDFTYTVTSERLPTYEMDASGNLGTGGEVPVRVNKQAIDITAQIMGDNWHPDPDPNWFFF